MVPVYQGLVEHHQTGRRALGGLRPDAHEKSQRMQGIVLSRMVVGNLGNEVFAEATLTVPENVFMHNGGKTGTHTEQLGYILTELQYLQRTYPGASW